MYYTTDDALSDMIWGSPLGHFVLTVFITCLFVVSLAGTYQCFRKKRDMLIPSALYTVLTGIFMVMMMS